MPVGAARAPGIPCTIELVEPTSLGTILHVQPFGATLKASTLTRDATGTDDAVTFRFQPERVHLFDAQGGQRLA